MPTVMTAERHAHPLIITLRNTRQTGQSIGISVLIVKAEKMLQSTALKPDLQQMRIITGISAWIAAQLKVKR